MNQYQSNRSQVKNTRITKVRNRNICHRLKVGKTKQKEKRGPVRKKKILYWFILRLYVVRAG